MGVKDFLVWNPGRTLYGKETRAAATDSANGSARRGSTFPGGIGLSAQDVLFVTRLQQNVGTPLTYPSVFTSAEFRIRSLPLLGSDVVELTPLPS